MRTTRLALLTGAAALALGGLTATGAQAATAAAAASASASASASSAPAAATTTAVTAATAKTTATRTIDYHGYSFEVPANWPVIDLSKSPDTCVRYDVHAVYLGHATAAGQATCPPALVGRTDAVLVEPLDGTGDAVVGPHTIVAPAGTAAYSQGQAESQTRSHAGGQTRGQAGSQTGAASAVKGEIDYAIPTAGVLVTATFGTRSGQQSQATTILASGRLLPGAHALRTLPRAAAPTGTTAAPTGATAQTGTTTRAAQLPAAGAAGVVRPADASGAQPGSFTGEGFDACTAPSSDQMSAWLSSSPYQALGVYIGGVNRACDQPNLTADWVSTVTAAGWHLFPLYVGTQAPCSNFNTVLSTDPATAYATGVSEADDAVAQAQAVGIPAASVIFNDMEAYDNTNASCSTGVLNYISGWTTELHNRGYLSGEYSSAGSGITDLVDQVGTGNYALPDDIDFAWWNDVADTDGGSYIPAGDWSEHQRIHQFHGGEDETYGGVTINVDGNSLDVGGGSVTAPPSTKYWVDTFANAPVYASPTSTVQTGTLDAGTNYVYCKVWGPMVGDSTTYNHWWLLTDPDVGPADQYVSAYYLSKWGNDQALDNNGNPIPDC
jgi:hypothetical protein